MTAPCPVCRQPAPLLFHARDENRRTTDERFPYFRCVDCGLVFLFPQPVSMGRYYPNDYYSIPVEMTETTPGVAGERFKLDIVRQLMPDGGRLLEIGPSWGQFLFHARNAGFEVEAMEMDTRCCEFLERKLGVCVIQSDNPAATLRERETAYDVIALWQVIEHLPDPWGFLAAAAARLRPGGVLVMAAPNPLAWQFTLFGKRWTHLDAPRHLHLIPAHLLVRLGGELGLQEALLTASDSGSLVWNRFGWEWSVVNLTPGARGHFRGAQRLQNFARHIGALLAGILGWRERADLRGAAYTLALRRPAGDTARAETSS